MALSKRSASKGTATTATAAGSSAGVPVRLEERPATQSGPVASEGEAGAVSVARPGDRPPEGPGGWRRRGGRGPRRLEAAAAGSDQDNFMSHFGGAAGVNTSERPGTNAEPPRSSAREPMRHKVLGRGRRQLLRSGWARAAGVGRRCHRGKRYNLTPSDRPNNAILAA